jgi:hypothetical protein
MREGRKQFFFEKKNQKTFIRWSELYDWRARKSPKVFCFFFSKKKSFLPLALAVCLAAAPPHTEQVPPERASGILGAAVQGPDGKDLGRIIDVLVDDTGKPRAAVIDFGGFFGMGTRHVAVSWTDLHFSPAAPAGMTIKLDLSADQIKAAPAYADAKPAAVVVAKPAPK